MSSASKPKADNKTVIHSYPNHSHLGSKVSVNPSMHFFKSTPLAAFAAAVLFFSTASAVPQGKGKPAPKPAPKPAVKHTENFKALKGSKNAPANFNHGQRYAILDLLTDGVGSSACNALRVRVALCLPSERLSPQSTHKPRSRRGTSGTSNTGE